MLIIRYTDRIETNHGPIPGDELQNQRSVARTVSTKLGIGLPPIITGWVHQWCTQTVPMDAIAQAEGKPRGFYSGVFGTSMGLHSTLP